MAKLAGAKDGKPFVKNDHRINKAGRPKKLPDLDSLLIDILGENLKGKEALKVVLLALRKKATSGDVRACELLLDRAYGKLVTKKDIDIQFETLSDETIELICNNLINKKENEKK
jgi:hypothetical protein